MNINSLPILLLGFVASVVSPLVAQTDIFSTPASKTKSPSELYPTSAAFFAATKTGAIPDMFVGNSESTLNAYKLGPAISNILQKEYGLNPHQSFSGDIGSSTVTMVEMLTKYECNNHEIRYAKDFQQAEDQTFGEVGRADGQQGYDHARAAFNKFATDYTKALKQYFVLKQDDEGKRQIAEADEQQKTLQEQRQAAMEKKEADAARQDILLTKREAVEEERRQIAAVKKAAEEERRIAEIAAQARANSRHATQAIENQAATDAMEKQYAVRKAKLDACLASAAYKLWEAAVVVKQGSRMIAEGQKMLDQDDAVKDASGVTDLATRRAAGIRIVAGREIAAPAFNTYQALGGKAASMALVEPGEDPAAEYR